MAMPTAAAWIGYQKISGPKIFGWRFWRFILKLIGCKIGPDPNDGHAHDGGMDWLSKIFGTENFVDGDSVDSYEN